MERTQKVILFIALVAALGATLFSAYIYESARVAFKRTLEARLVQAAELGASEVAREDMTEVRQQGLESNAFWNLMGQLDVLYSAVGVGNLALLDSTRNTIYDVQQGNRGLFTRSAYDSLAPAAVHRALRGLTTVAVFRRDRLEASAAFAPVSSGKRVVGLVIAEAPRVWERDVLRLRAQLTLLTAVCLALIAATAYFLTRTTGREQRLQRLLLHAQSSNWMNHWTAELAHQVKNPFANIRGSARRLAKLEPEAERMAQSIVDEVDRLTRIVARYRQWALGYPREIEIGDATTALSATLDWLEDRFRERGCMLERLGLDAPARVRIGTDVFKELSYNLVLNALEAVPDGGLIRVVMAMGEHDVEIRVEDNGPGIPPAVLRQMGVPFFTTKPQGTGIGLSQARREVEAAGGRLRVVSRAGEGTAVIIRLPLVRG